MNGSLKKNLKCLAILTTVLFIVSTFSIIVLGETQTISTEERIYKVGDVVTFSGSGLVPEANYTLQVYHGDLLVYSVEFTATSEGSLPASLSWDSSSSDPGTYTVKLLDSEGNVVSQSVFGLVEINEVEFMPHDWLTISGGGAEPYGSLNITITYDSELLFNTSVIADENGEFNVTIQLPFNITTGDYVVEIYVISEEAPDVTFQIFVNATTSNMINVTASELEDLIALISDMNITIKQSLLAKLQNALMKLEQAENHLQANQSHVAKNMLKAARNILNALLNEVRAQWGKHLDNETAAYMNSSIQEAMNELKVTQSSLDKPGKRLNDHNGVAENGSSNGRGHHGNDETRGNNHGNSGESHGKKKGHSKHGGKNRGRGRR